MNIHMKKTLLLCLFLLAPSVSLASDITSSSSLRAGLVSYWMMDDNGGIRYDATSTNDLADNNTVGTSTGKFVLSSDFEKSNSETLSIADASQTGLDSFTAFSVSTWVKWESLPSSDGTDRHIFGKGVDSQGGYRFTFFSTTDRALITYWDTSGNEYQEATGNYAATSSDIGTWVHYVVTVVPSAKDIKLFKNGTEITTSAYSGAATNIGNSGLPFRIGSNGNASPSQYMDGLIDEFGLWKRQLSTGEITGLYNGGVGLAYEESASGSSTSSGTFLAPTFLSMLNNATCILNGATTSCSFAYSTSTVSVFDSIQLSALVLFLLGALAFAGVGYAYTVWIMKV